MLNKEHCTQFLTNNGYTHIRFSFVYNKVWHFMAIDGEDLVFVAFEPNEDEERVTVSENYPHDSQEWAVLEVLHREYF